MADNFFAQFDPDEGGTVTPTVPAPQTAQEPASDNFFAQFDPDNQPENETNFGGAFARSGERSIIPATAGVVSGAAGAEAGAAIGGGIGSLVGGVGAIPGAAVGAIIGGLGAGFAGSYAADQAQTIAAKALPESWKDVLGGSDRQQQIDETYQPTASFLGGLVPYAMTLRPGGLGSAAAKLPANATAWQKIAANPVTSRLFSGALMGGMQVGQQTASGQPINWQDAAIATGFGMVFNKPTKFGETLEGIGARVVPGAAHAAPTVAQAGDAKVVGPGITEDVAMGNHQQSVPTEMASQDAARTEASVLGTVPASQPDVGTVARKMEPELFGQWDTLAQQQDDLRSHLAALASPSDEDISAATQQRDDLLQQLDAHVASRGGYEGGADARALRAQVRNQQAQIDDMTERRDAFAAGEGADTPEMTAIREQIQATDVAMRDLAPQISAATRRAADYLGTQTVEPENVPTVQNEQIVQNEQPVQDARAGGPITPQEQQEAAAIASQVAQQAMAAGRPAEEAEAYGQLVGQRYIARSRGFNGVMRSPLDLYNLEGAQIRSGEPVAAQEAAPAAKSARKGKTPPVVTPEDALAASDSIGATKLVRQLFDKGVSDADISGVLSGKLSEPQVAALRQSFGAQPAPELVQAAPAVPQGEMDRAALAEYLRNGGSVSARGKELLQGKLGSIRIVEGRRPVIKLFADANASTLIHETGHEWLEQLLSDSGHEAATDALKADGTTARNWLGMKAENDRPTTAQHEKFAKGFEQYMREGIAPSPQLAGVFAKFRNWLTNIYRTLQGLGAPISDDIRGVFDRLIATNPDRTVISSENARGPSLAEQHEADAGAVHPAEGEQLGDRIRAERDDDLAGKPAKVAAELSGAAVEPGAETEPGAAGEPILGEGGGESVTEPGSGGGGGERGTVQQGGGNGVSESNALSAGGPEPGLRQQRPSAAGNAGSANPLAPDAGAILPRADSKLTDRAGNIRVENLTTAEDVAQAIKQSAAENNEFIGNRRGVITDGQVLDLADALGMDASALNRRQIGQAFNAEQIVAARKLLIQSATDLSGAAQRAADGTDADVAAYAKAKARHNMIQGQVAGITAEAGRALRAFRSLVGQQQANAIGEIAQQSDARTLFQLKAEAKLMAELQTPEAVSKFARDAAKPDFWDHVLEYWTNGLISNPATHATYAAGTEMMSLLRAGPETAVASAIGAIRKALGRQGEVVHLGEVRAAMAAHFQAAPAGAKAMADAIVNGTTTLLPGEKPHSTPFQPKGEFAPHGTLQEGYTGADLLSDLYGTTRGILDGTLVSGALARAAERAKEEPGFGLESSPLGTIPNVRLANGMVVPTGDIARLPSRGVAALHSFFKATNYSMNMARLAVRQASEEGLSGQAFDARVAELRQSPTPAMFDAYDKAQRSGGTVAPEIEAAVLRSRAAAAEAMDTTLMGPGSEFTRALSNLTNKRIFGLPILKFIDPFVKIGANVINQAIVERTPLGILAPEIRADLSGKNGNVAQDTAMAKMLVGTALSVGFGALAARGVISGSGPSDPNRAAMWRLAGNQPYSVRIGDTWYSMSHLGPLGMMLGVAADMYDVAHMASEGNMLQAGATLQHAITQNILDESFMRGPSDLIEAVDNPGRYGQAYIRNLASSFMPFSSLSSQLARMSDPYSREARSVMDAIKAKTPGMSETLLPRRNIWGEPMPNYGALGGMTSVYMQPVSRDPVNLALWNLGINVGQPDRSVRGVRLSDQQYDYYQMTAGRMAHSRLETIVTSPDWQTWSPEAQHNVVQEVVSQSRETARGAIMGRWPQIASEAVQAKMRRLN
jgi:hypothetical protein